MHLLLSLSFIIPVFDSVFDYSVWLEFGQSLMRDPFIGPREGNDEIGDKPSVELDWFFYDDIFINPAVPSELERRGRRFPHVRKT